MLLIAKLHKGSLFLPLLLILSFSGLLLVKAVAVKSFEGYQSGVTNNFDKRFELSSTKYALSNFIGESESWKVFVNSQYNYQMKYPRSWIITPNSQNETGFLNRVKITFANKIDLTVNVKKNSDFQKSWQKVTINDNEFYLHKTDKNVYTSEVEHNKLYYEITLSENSFFANERDFKNTFLSILKNFEFVN